MTVHSCGPLGRVVHKKKSPWLEVDQGSRPPRGIRMHRDGHVGVLAPLGDDLQFFVGVLDPSRLSAWPRAANKHEVTQLERRVRSHRSL